MNRLPFPLALAALLCPGLPAYAQTPPPDPVAYSCYFCTDEEMEQVAIDQGAGNHYVYDVSRDPRYSPPSAIYGYTIRLEGGVVSVSRFEPEPWLKQQYSVLIGASRESSGIPVHVLKNVELLPPDHHHGRSAVSRYLWGHHTSALNPLHPRARQTLRRWIDANVDLAYMRADEEHGRVLQFAFQKGGLNPTLLRLETPGNERGVIIYYMDRATRRWEYLGAQVEENVDDFAGPTGVRQFEYSASNSQQLHMEAFLQRAQWAGVPVQGTFSMRVWNYVDCERVSGDTTCTIWQK